MNYEEELQKNLENGKPVVGDELDLKAYQQVFKVLGMQPNYDLSSDFAAKVAARVSEQKSKGLSGDLIWFGVGIFLLFISFVVALVISLSWIGFKPSLGFLSGISEYKGLIVLAIVLVTIFNMVEKKLIGKRMA
jgi:hypothetical protein